MCDFMLHMNMTLFLKTGILALAVNIIATLALCPEVYCAPPLEKPVPLDIVQDRKGPAGNPPSQDFVLQEISVSSIIVDNNRVIPAALLQEMVFPYLNRRISYVDLEILRNRLTQWLVDNGYINSGVIIPDQDVNNGIVHLTLIEGKLSTVTVEGTRQFSGKYFIDRIKRRAETPFRVNDLQEAFQLLYQDQRVTAINAELSAGLTPGESSLNFRVTEASPWQLSLNVTNDNSPSIGSYHGGLQLAHRNLSGGGDTLEGNIGGSEGSFDYGLRYSLPLSSADTMLDLYFRRSSAHVISFEFEPLDIRSSSGTYGGRVSHPLVRTVRREIRPSLAFEYRESRNYLLGEGFSFSTHEDNGKSHYSAGRLGLEWVERGDGSVVVASSILNTGVREENFISLLGRLLWMQRTGIVGSSINFRGEAQIADTGLTSMEKYALGGINSVRGYRKNVLVKDNGVTGSLEWWFPLVKENSARSESLSVAPFVDYGRGWDNGAGSNAPRDLASIGVGLRSISNGLSVDLFYGYGLLDSGVRKTGDPQENGIHFSVTWSAM